MPGDDPGGAGGRRRILHDEIEAFIAIEICDEIGATDSHKSLGSEGSGTVDVFEGEDPGRPTQDDIEVTVLVEVGNEWLTW